MPRPAAGADVAALHALREERARWMVDTGIRQWRPGEVGRGEIAGQVAAGEWHVLIAGGELVGALRLLWADPDVWGMRPDDAGYVHGLAVVRAHAGRRIGAGLLSWAEEQVAGAGRAHLRLDCVEANARLRDYYRDQGFREVGRRGFHSDWDPVVLLEKDLATGRSPSSTA
ncbi:GNAT family N-acetyltransferase [Blastococcus sp. SYSU DS0619]